MVSLVSWTRRIFGWRTTKEHRTCMTWKVGNCTCLLIQGYHVLSMDRDTKWCKCNSLQLPPSTYHLLYLPPIPQPSATAVVTVKYQLA
jgi:hypothetical protein